MKSILKTLALAVLLTTFSLCQYVCALAAETSHSCCPGSEKQKPVAQCCSIVSFVSKAEVSTAAKAAVAVPPAPFLASFIVAELLTPADLPAPELPPKPPFLEFFTALTASPNAPPAQLA